MTDTTKWTEYADKYAVRQHVTEVLGDGLLTKCYGVWEHVDDIDFDALPQSFAIKSTHDCGSTVIVKDKQSADISEIKEFLKKCLLQKFGYKTIEPHYATIKPRIMAEELLPQENPELSTSQVDYKI